MISDIFGVTVYVSMTVRLFLDILRSLKCLSVEKCFEKKDESIHYFVLGLALGQSRFLVEVSLRDDSLRMLSRGNPRANPNVLKGRFTHGSK